MTDPTTRFSNRVEAYIRYRPGYPSAVIKLLERECGLTPGSVVADVGSGTGILSETFLRLGCRVFGVEPNREMRQAAEQLLAGFPRFVSVGGRAEATTLPDRGVDLVTAGQAFHWFDRTLARAEFERVLKPGGWVVLAWNKRRKVGTAIAEGLESLLRRYATDYQAVDHDNVTDEVIAGFFAPVHVSVIAFDSPRRLDLEHLEGYLKSASYAPEPGHPNHEPLLAGLREIFTACQEGGTVTLDNQAVVYYGHLT